MSRATPQLRNIAEYLVALEARKGKSYVAQTPAAFVAGGALRPHLANLMGTAGFHALLSRALVLAATETPWLRTVVVTADGGLQQHAGQHVEVGPESFFKGRVALLSQLLGLLMVFIGESLTLRLVRDVWPTLPLTDLDAAKGDKNEEAN